MPSTANPTSEIERETPQKSNFDTDRQGSNGGEEGQRKEGFCDTKNIFFLMCW